MPSDQFRPFGLAQGCARVLEKPGAGIGQGDRSLGALEQHDAKSTLQLLDLLRERGRADAQALGGAGEMQLLGHGDEVAEVSEFDLHRICEVLY